MNAQGWYHDPYRIHEDRWYSDGAATSLVRDDHVESADPPPEFEPAGPYVRSEEELPAYVSS